MLAEKWRWNQSCALLLLLLCVHTCLHWYRRQVKFQLALQLSTYTRNVYWLQITIVGYYLLLEIWSVGRMSSWLVRTLISGHMVTVRVCVTLCYPLSLCVKTPLKKQ